MRGGSAYVWGSRLSAAVRVSDVPFLRDAGRSVSGRRTATAAAAAAGVPVPLLPAAAAVPGTRVGADGGHLGGRGGVHRLHGATGRPAGIVRSRDVLRRSRPGTGGDGAAGRRDLPAARTDAFAADAPDDLRQLSAAGALAEPPLAARPEHVLLHGKNEKRRGGKEVGS